MVIKKLNTFFHRNSRWLFGAFTIVIIVSFLGFLTPGTFGFGDMSNPEKISMGTAYGEDVTYGELRDVSRNLSIFSEVFNGVSLSRELPQEAMFSYVCIIRKAGKLGLSASDREVAAIIRQAPVFVRDGKFDKSAYDNAVKNLRRSGITEKDLYDACRQQIIINKFQQELTGGITATEGEAEELFRRLNTAFTIRVIEFPAEKTAGMKVSDKELETFFASRRSAYQIPGRINALAVGLDYAAFKGQAAKMASAKAVKAFFDRNPKAFETDKVKNPGFDAVKARVRTAFIDAAAKEIAMKEAYDFATRAYETLAEVPLKDKEKTFRDLAAKAKYVVIEAGSADFGAASVGKINSAMLVKQLSGLVGSNTVTDPIPEDKAVYIGFLRSRTMPRPAELKEVSAKVRKDCLADKAAAAAFKKAADAHAGLLRARPNQVNALLAKIKGCKTTDFDFIPMSKQPPEAFAEAAVAALNLNVGAFTAPLRKTSGTVIARLVKRTAPDMKEFAKQKEMYIMLCRNQKVSLAMQALQDELAANCRFTGNGQNN